MSDNSPIEWTDATWNPTKGCSRVSEGCRNCYAEKIAGRFSGPGNAFDGFATMKNGEARWTGKVELDEKKLDKPLRWKRPLRIFVNSMSDLFHETLTNEEITAVFGVMAAAPQHTFQVLTKRAARMCQYFSWLGERGGLGRYIRSITVDGDRTLPNLFAVAARTEVVRGKTYRASDDPWMMVFNAAACIGGGVLSNVWLGVSVEDQETADERIPWLLKTPAAKRYISYEPALGPVDFNFWLKRPYQLDNAVHPSLDWIIVGGESGPKARPFNVQWARDTITQCKAASVACFVKQLGARPFDGYLTNTELVGGGRGRPRPADQPLTEDVAERIVRRSEELTGLDLRMPRLVSLNDRKGGDMSEWPADLRVRQFPERSPNV